MTQYLLSVYHAEPDPMPSEEEMQRVYAQVDAVNAEIMAAGAWVFAGGLHPPSSATVVRVRDGETVITDGPYLESKEQLGGFWVIECADLDAALDVVVEGRPPRARTRSRCARSRGSRRPDRVVPFDAPQFERVFRSEFGRAVATLTRLFGDLDVAEEAVQDAFTIAASRWPEGGLPPNPGAWITTTARNRAIDRLRREASRNDRHAAAVLLHARDEEREEAEDVMR